jgi:phosphoserine phosphatase RsbU/P
MSGSGRDGATAAGRFLVVDDNENNRDLLARRVERLGHRVEKAENGRIALDRLRAEELDVVLLDIMMPEMDGYQVLEAIKADPHLRHLRVIMISAVEETESVTRCLALGADDYLPKPFDPAVLAARIGSSLDRKRLHDREKVHLRSIERELEIGREIQAGFLPAACPRSTAGSWRRPSSRRARWPETSTTPSCALRRKSPGWSWWSPTCATRGSARPSSWPSSAP